jgi:hypothetical protein
LCLWLAIGCEQPIASHKTTHDLHTWICLVRRSPVAQDLSKVCNTGEIKSTFVQTHPKFEHAP